MNNMETIHHTIATISKVYPHYRKDFDQVVYRGEHGRFTKAPEAIERPQYGLSDDQINRLLVGLQGIAIVVWVVLIVKAYLISK